MGVREIVMKFLKLIRFPNLLIIAVTQYLVRYTIILPILAAYNLTSAVSDINFFFIVVSTVLIAAGGYIINDYHDLQIDLINKPGKVIVDKFISKKTCFNLYAGLSLSGIAIGIYLSFFQGIFLFWQINILSFALLLIYSTTLKKVLLIGNISIAALSALSIYLLLIIEKNTWINFLQNRQDSINAIPYIVSAYALFAFIMTLIREVIKDYEDKEGDALFNRNTLPIVSGNFISKLFVSFLILVVLFCLILIQYRQQQWQDKVSFFYVVAAIEIPLLVLLTLLLRAGKKKDYAVSSLLTKGIMLTGILSMLVFYLRYK
jgi:4-hydroxybenzoate polyprenyltransferase